MSAIVATSMAQEAGSVQNPSLHLLLRTDGSCFVVGEPVKARIELVNVSTKPQVVLNTLDYYGSGHLMGTLPIINGQADQWLGTWLDERGLIPPQLEQFTALWPNESTLTWFDNFWDFVRASRYQPEPPPGIYTLAVSYRNEFKGPARFVIDGSSQFDVVYADLNAWTGVLYSDPVTIRMVRRAEECGPVSATIAAS